MRKMAECIASQKSNSIVLRPTIKIFVGPRRHYRHYNHLCGRQHQTRPLFQYSRSFRLTSREWNIIIPFPAFLPSH